MTVGAQSLSQVIFSVAIIGPQDNKGQGSHSQGGHSYHGKLQKSVPKSKSLSS